MKRQAKRDNRSKLLKKKRIAISSRSGKTVRARSRAAPKIVEDPRLKLVREQYEAAVRSLNQQKYSKAISLFEKIVLAPFPDLAERARVHLNICRQRLERPSVQLRTPEDHYNYAVAKINAGELEEAEAHLERALKHMPKADHVHYALAAVKSLRGDVEGALARLKAAIELEPRNRYLARNDRDFAALFEDPRFADLIYPEKGTEDAP